MTLTRSLLSEAPRVLPRLIVATAIFGSATRVAAQAPGLTSTAAADTSQIERSRLPNPALPLSASSTVLGDSGNVGEDNQQSVAPSSSGDSDLGVQSLLKQATPHPQPWSIFADGGFVNTTNVALTKNNALNDTFAVAEIGVGYDWRLRDDLSVSFAAREQYFAYDRFDQLDFGALNLGIGLNYTLPTKLLGDGVVLSSQLGYTRLTRRGFDNEFYRSGTLSFGLQKLVPIGRAQLVSYGGDILLGISVPHLPQREEFGLSAGYVVQLTRHFSLQTGARVAYFDYESIDRDDVNFSVSAGATYAFTSWCSLGATISGIIDRSDHAVFDYNVFNSGGSVFFRLRF